MRILVNRSHLLVHGHGEGGGREPATASAHLVLLACTYCSTFQMIFESVLNLRCHWRLLVYEMSFCLYLAKGRFLYLRL